ncbi:hypothetical protein OV079_38790 [Nannocystis pusilla]|uniref:VCBS repeat-containing protein n=1 Tax=Nannocystis pusilla TaxID=889268 RepID=A0A9X3EXJ6_9BACT|nr:hypothetical protein [Nannocystis pusilla]MCY1011409.1 hypothetical protein [Nannocystis pusilla]
MKAATRRILGAGVPALAIACSTAAGANDTDGGPTGNATDPVTSISSTGDPSSPTASAGGSEGTSDAPTSTTDFDPTGQPEGTTSGTTGEPPAPSCDGSGGPAVAAEPVLSITLKDRWEEAWLGSPAVADLDGDGDNEIIVPRGQALLAWAADGEVLFKFEAEGGRSWASPVVANFIGGPELEIAFAARDKVYLLDSTGAIAPGFPVTWEDELRSIAAGDLDGDGGLDIAVSVGHGGPTDVVNAWRSDGTPLPGFPPNQSGSFGCDDKCYLAGCYDQNLAVGDLDGDGKADLVAPHDNAYASIHKGSGEAFDAADLFPVTKTPGVRYLHVLAEAMQGYAEDEETALQAHFTNTAPAIADLDGDGQREVVMLASVQNAAQSDREKGVAVWVVGADASRRPGFDPPVHLPDYLGPVGLRRHQHRRHHQPGRGRRPARRPPGPRDRVRRLRRAGARRERRGPGAVEHRVHHRSRGRGRRRGDRRPLGRRRARGRVQQLQHRRRQGGAVRARERRRGPAPAAAAAPRRHARAHARRRRRRRPGRHRRLAQGRRGHGRERARLHRARLDRLVPAVADRPRQLPSQRPRAVACPKGHAVAGDR